MQLFKGAGCLKVVRVRVRNPSERRLAMVGFHQANHLRSILPPLVDCCRSERHRTESCLSKLLFGTYHRHSHADWLIEHGKIWLTRPFWVKMLSEAVNQSKLYQYQHIHEQAGSCVTTASQHSTHPFFKASATNKNQEPPSYPLTRHYNG